jgi:hypothetical protein
MSPRRCIPLIVNDLVLSGGLDAATGLKMLDILLRDPQLVTLVDDVRVCRFFWPDLLILLAFRCWLRCRLDGQWEKRQKGFVALAFASWSRLSSSHSPVKRLSLSFHLYRKGYVSNEW